MDWQWNEATLEWTEHPAKPYASWIWDGETWQPPIPYPGKGADWNELEQKWNLHN